MALPPRWTIDSDSPVPILGGFLGDSFGTFPQSYVTFDTAVKFVHGRQVPKDLSYEATEILMSISEGSTRGIKAFYLEQLVSKTGFGKDIVSAAVDKLVKNGLIFAAEWGGWSLDNYRDQIEDSSW